MTKIEHEIDDRLFRNAMGSFATGVTVITTEVENGIHGMTANAFMSISLNPKLIAISVDEKAKMLDHIKKAGKFAVNILSKDQKEVSMQFAGQNKEDVDVSFVTYKGLPTVENSLAVVTCEVQSGIVAGDHTIFIGQVTGVKLESHDPLLFSKGQYRELQGLQELQELQ
ncbi:flavin reductase family protein [Sporosarcina jiandibaonis]|uniref:flavin reductase family protein n=1 Tax=Sporosarcina jiandibaonis TaxID=2715535 RepID=UPI001C12DA64|nr:flavin reductase family protein [Sporosarcina jiandibaonis]